MKLLYGSGLRIMEAVRLRIKDVDLAMKQVTVRSQVLTPDWTPEPGTGVMVQTQSSENTQA